MRRPRLTVLLLAASMWSSALSGANVQARLEVTPSHVLPGLPSMFIVTISNRDNAAHAMPNLLRIRVTPAGKESFYVLWGGNNDETGMPGDDVIVLGPSETREFYFPDSDMLLLNEAFWDARLTIPGSYDLRAELGDNFATVSNAARLTIDQPAGDDLQVWHLMQQKSPTGWPVNRWIDDAAFVAAYPKSKYAIATVALRTPRPQLRNVLPDAIQNSNGPLRDDLRLLMVSLLRTAADDVFRAGDMRNSDLLMLEAAVYADQLRHDGSTRFAEKEGARAIEEMNALSLVRHLDPQLKTPYRKLIPLGPCKGENGTLEFGYDNANKWPIIMRVGRENRFDPQPENRGQVTVFQPGKHLGAFAVPVLPDETLKWTLDEAILTYRRELLKSCRSSDDEH